jgi:chemotaxis protein MotB
MNNLRRLIVLAASLAALAACTKSMAPADIAADKAAIDAIEDAYYKGYNAGDGAAVATLYAADAVLNAPGLPALRGNAAISDFFVKDAADFASAGHSEGDGPTSEFGVSGDLAWRWGTYKIIDKSGATVDVGKYITVFQRTNGKWMIIRDTWNSDSAPAAASAEASQQKYSELQNEYEQLSQAMSAEVGAKNMQISRLENAIKVSVNSELLFPSGGWEMPAKAKETIGKMAAVLAPHHTTKISVKGYTDNAPVGTGLQKQGVSSNLILSQKRADNVTQYMISQGVNPTLVSARGYGDADPVASNDTPAGRAQNRRVELTLATPSQ